MDKKPKLRKCSYVGCDKMVVKGLCFKHKREVMIVQGYETRGILQRSPRRGGEPEASNPLQRKPLAETSTMGSKDQRKLMQELI